MKKGAVLFTGTLLFSCILFVFGIPRDQNLTSPGDPAPEVCFFCGRMLRYFHHFICIHMHSRSVKVMKTWKVFREEPKRQRVSRYGRSCRIPVLFGGPLQTRLPSWRQSDFPAFSRECTDRFCGLIAVHVRHLNIHQNNIVIIFWCVLDCF